MSSDATASSDLLVPAEDPVRPAIKSPAPVALAAALAALADWLFFNHPLGISIAVFLAAILAGFIAANRNQLQLKALPRAGAVFVVSVIPLVVELSFPAVIFAVLGTAYFVIAATQEGAAWKVRAADI